MLVTVRRSEQTLFQLPASRPRIELERCKKLKPEDIVPSQFGLKSSPIPREGSRGLFAVQQLGSRSCWGCTWLRTPGGDCGR